MKQICLQKIWLGHNTKSMQQNCVGMTNTTALHKMERVMSKGGCQELQRAYDWKTTTEARLKMEENRISALGIKKVKEQICILIEQ